MSKYYTPTIDEFHVGFEYEEKSSGLWTKQIYDDVSPILNQKYWDDYGVPYDTMQDYINQEIVRVKYLDQQDIEDLGFKKTNNIFKLDNYNTFVDMATGARIISFDDKLRTPNADGTFKQYIIFKGFIKNKSELKKILQQIGVL